MAEEASTNYQYRLGLLQEMFPAADPDFLLRRVEAIANDLDFNDLIMELSENRVYPTKRDSTRKKLGNDILRKYVNDFNVDDFCNQMHNPKEFFQNNPIELPHALSEYVLQRFLNFFPRHSVDVIKEQLMKHKNSIFKAYLQLTKEKPLLTKGRGRANCEVQQIENMIDYESCFRILAYLEHKEMVDDKFQLQQATDPEEQARGLKRSHAIECQCCYETGIAPLMCVTCKKGHEFCKECVKKSSEILIMEQKLTFPCLTTCDSFFSDETIESVLSEKTMQSLNTKRQLKEIESAGLDGLEACIHCSFYQQVSPENKIFECLNPQCLRATCRQCLKDAHIPYKCEEVSDEVKRTYIENKMSEALISKCYKCGLQFIKEDGCNHMQCTCGAWMCYVCKQPVSDLSHFIGGNCLLFKNFKAMDLEKVKNSATEAFEKRFN